MAGARLRTHVLHVLGLLVVETATARVILGKLETAERHTVEIGDQALIFQRELGLISGLYRVT
jgi:hypothetical protein